MLFKYIKKLVTKPSMFFGDSFIFLLWKCWHKNIGFVFGVKSWKRQFISLYFPEHKLVYCSNSFSKRKLDILKRFCNSSILITWGYNEPGYFKLSKELIYRVEDGFLRSKELGANKSLPYSLIIDTSSHLYFDSRGVSTLESILINYDFKKNHNLLHTAASIKNNLILSHVSKYNNSNFADLSELQIISSTKTNVLIVGQCEDDASILYGKGSFDSLSNLDLVKESQRLFPNANRIFKEHPDVICGKRKRYSSLKSIAAYANVIDEDIPISQLLNNVNVVFVITSLVGMEALIRGLKVYSLGQPFYSGWGLTNDLNPIERRQRRLNIDELFAASFLLYPMYRCPHNGLKMDINTVINKLKK